MQLLLENIPIAHLLFGKKIYRILDSELRYIFFEPGDYTITISAKYWVDPEKPPKGEFPGGKYHTKVESKTLTVDSPQSVILLGAGFGGLIAYFLLPQARKKTYCKV